MPRPFALTIKAAALLLVLEASSCKASDVPPLTSTLHPDTPEKNASNVLVLMFPGVGDEGEAYVDHGFVQELQAARKGVDIVTVDAYRQFFGARALLAR